MGSSIFIYEGSRGSSIFIYEGSRDKPEGRKGRPLMKKGRGPSFGCLYEFYDFYGISR